MKRFLFILKRCLQATFIVGVAVLFCITFISAVNTSKQHVSSAIQVHLDFPVKQQLIDEAEVIAILNDLCDSNIVGKPLVSLDFKQLETQLRKNPFVANAELYVDQKHCVHATIKQRVPFLRVINSDGVSYYLTKDQLKMPLHDNFTVDIPLATGYVKTYEDIEGDSIVQLQLCELIQALQSDTLLASLIDHVEVQESGAFKLIPKFSYHDVYFGKMDEFVKKRLENLKSFYKQVLVTKGWNSFSSINIELPNQLIATKRDSI